MILKSRIPPLLVSLFQRKDPHNAGCTATWQSFHSQPPEDKKYYTYIQMSTKFRYKQSIQDLDKPEEDEGVSVPILPSVGEVC